MSRISVATRVDRLLIEPVWNRNIADLLLKVKLRVASNRIIIERNYTDH